MKKTMLSIAFAAASFLGAGAIQAATTVDAPYNLDSPTQSPSDAKPPMKSSQAPLSWYTCNHWHKYCGPRHIVCGKCK